MIALHCHRLTLSGKVEDVMHVLPESVKVWENYVPPR